MAGGRLRHGTHLRDLKLHLRSVHSIWRSAEQPEATRAKAAYYTALSKLPFLR